MKFTKMQGTGNDFVILEDFDEALKGNQNELAKKLCDRRFGIGADGVLFVRKSDAADIKMDIVNADGSEAAMCGNGIRCFAKYVYDEGIVKSNIIKIETGDGIKIAHLTLENSEVSGITIDMGNYSLDPKDAKINVQEKIVNKRINVNDKEYSVTSMLMGVPHTAIMCKLDEVDVTEGKAIEKCELFIDGTNVNFCEVVNEDTIKVKTWERGAGPTLACGTGSCASVVATNLLGFTNRKVRVIVPGGEMFIEVSDNSVFMTGPAVTVFKGEITI